MACIDLARGALCLFNFIFLLMGVSLLVVGIMLKTDDSLIHKFLLPILERLGAGKSHVRSLFATVGTVFIGLGVLGFYVGALGFVGTLCKIRMCVLGYGILVMLLTIGEVVVLALVFTMKSKAETFMKDELKALIINEYDGINGTRPVGKALNLMFIKFNCCGVDNYLDVQKAKNWNRTQTIEIGDVTAEVELYVPHSCCKGIVGDFPDFEWPKKKDWLKCAVDTNMDQYVNKKGCFQPLLNYIIGKAKVIIAVGITIALFEVCCVVAAMCLYSEWKKEGEMV